MRPIAKGLKKVFLVHGEQSQGAALAQMIQKTYGIDTMQASRGDTVDL
jgi:predicted metal-dependent RNase